MRAGPSPLYPHTCLCGLALGWILSILSLILEACSCHSPPAWDLQSLRIQEWALLDFLFWTLSPKVFFLTFGFSCLTIMKPKSCSSCARHGEPEAKRSGGVVLRDRVCGWGGKTPSRTRWALPSGCDRSLPNLSDCWTDDPRSISMRARPQGRFLVEAPVTSQDLTSSGFQ